MDRCKFSRSTQFLPAAHQSTHRHPTRLKGGVIYSAVPRSLLASNANRAAELLALKDLSAATKVSARVLIDLLT